MSPATVPTRHLLVGVAVLLPLVLAASGAEAAACRKVKGSCSLMLVTGDNQFTSSAGTLQTKDAIVLRTAGAGDFAEVDTIVGGTGQWAGASGVLRTQGTFSATAGGGGDYLGELCRT